MAEYVEDQQIYPVLVELTTCVQNALVQRGLAPMDATTIQPGDQPVLDYVGNGKMCSELVINVNTGYPVGDQFPVLKESADAGTEMVYEINIGIYRCAPMVTGAGAATKPPKPEVQLSAVRDQLADKAAMLYAVRCCLHDKYQYAVRAFRTYGPAGGATGCSWTILVGGAI